MPQNINEHLALQITDKIQDAKWILSRQRAHFVPAVKLRIIATAMCRLGDAEELLDDYLALVGNDKKGE